MHILDFSILSNFFIIIAIDQIFIIITYSNYFINLKINHPRYFFRIYDFKWSCFKFQVIIQVILYISLYAKDPSNDFLKFIQYFFRF